jgi:restriction endonuclease S subunit
MIDLSQNIDSTKVFIINRSILNGRYDPEMVLYSKKTNTFIFEAVPLKKLLKKNPQYGANESGIERTSFEEPRYIRITDIDEFGLLNESIGVTAQRVEEKYILNNNDILFARSGATVGKAYLHKSENVNYQCFFAGYMIRFVVDETKILPEYLFTYTQLNLYKVWVKAIQRAAGQPNINAEEYKSLLVALPPIKIQTEIVDKINNAYKLKQQKEAEAKALLEGIDNYLLKELGIELPQKDHSIENRVFTTHFSELTGGRFDAFAILNKDFKIEGGKFKNKKLKHIAFLLKGKSITSDKIIEGEYPVIAGGQTSPYSHNEYNYEGNIITVSASGAYSGFVWHHTYPIFASDCTVIFSKDETEISTLFLSEILKTKQQEIYHLQQGAGQPHVYSRDLKELNVPIPPLQKQNEIANYIQEIRIKAHQLQNEAKDVLESAKQEVERIILG